MSSQPPSPAGYSQTPCPQHSHPSQTQAPVNTGSPCDYTRLGTGRGENQASLLFQQVWITQSILPPNLLLLLLYSSRSEASLLSHTLGDLDFWLAMISYFSPFFFRKYDGESIKKQWKNCSAYCFSCQIHACWNPPGSFTAVKAENTVATFGSHFYRIFVLSHIFHFSRKRVSRH